LSLGVASTISIWIAGNKISNNSDKKIVNLKKMLHANDSLNKSLNIELQKLNKLADKQKPRHLTKEQRDKFKSNIKNMPNISIFIYSVGENDEAYSFATEFLEIFKQEKYDVYDGILTVQKTGEPYTGISLAVRDNKNPPLSAIAIQGAFSSIGIKASGGPRDNTINQNAIKIIVGHRK
jgi:hypothetical protein